MKIGCIGTGAMGGAIMRAVCKKYDVSQIKVTDKNTEMGKTFASETGATFVENNTDVLDCDYIFLAVKPETVAATITLACNMLALSTTLFAIV